MALGKEIFQAHHCLQYTVFECCRESIPGFSKLHLNVRVYFRLNKALKQSMEYTGLLVSQGELHTVIRFV
jgi:hypothetical protein